MTPRRLLRIDPAAPKPWIRRKSVNDLAADEVFMIRFAKQEL
jgi:hypothetical protein